MDNQTFKNDPDNRCDEDISELDKQLRSIWRGRMFWNQTLDQDVECDPKEIRALFDDEPDENKDEEPTSLYSNPHSSGPTRLPCSRPSYTMRSRFILRS